MASVHALARLIKQAGPGKTIRVISSIRLHQLLLVVSGVLPALLFAAAAWQNHGDVLREGRDLIARTTAVMGEHGRKVFETADLAIGQIRERIDDPADMEPDPVATAEFLRRLNAPMDQFAALLVSDGNGRTVASSGAATASIAGTGFFAALKRQPDHLVIGTAGEAGGAPPAFAITRARETGGGHFAGSIVALASAPYFERFYADAAPIRQHVGILVRADGAILARDPPNPARTRMEPETPLLRRIAEGRAEGVVHHDTGLDGVERDFAVRRVGTYPAYVAFAVPHRVLLAPWYHNLLVYGAVALGTASILVGTSFLALRRARAEQAALARLRAEVAGREAAEEQLRHAQRMEAVGQLTGGVAHDFNNLLTAVLGNLEMIGRARGRPDAPERIDRLVRTAIKAVERGAALTRSLLAFSRKQPMVPVPLDANARLAEFMDLVRQALGVAIPVRFEPAPGLPPCVADPAELERALLNLAINARDAMPEGGTLLIATALTTLGPAALEGNTEARPGRFVAITVADTGTGMPPEVAARAFEPFFTTKPLGEGTGLGLSQVFGFVRQLGGHVSIRCPPEGGTAVTLFLPASAPV